MSDAYNDLYYKGFQIANRLNNTLVKLSYGMSRIKKESVRAVNRTTF
ncbi:2529_t:CDS:2 [Cetraspora pellucida]|uniref:2529_t:CDS:1 n=1 Tax=Cetraspora pellucida TaxID=1433469 RepID=A0A9N9FM08_9GLOM|nr:2529_t:CDS:2 [Cetraspora pellucida]